MHTRLRPKSADRPIRAAARLAPLVCLGALAAAGASPAQGATFTLSLTGPPTAVVGKPLALQASGLNPPPAEYWFVSYLDVLRRRHRQSARHAL